MIYNIRYIILYNLYMIKKPGCGIFRGAGNQRKARSCSWGSLEQRLSFWQFCGPPGIPSIFRLHHRRRDHIKARRLFSFSGLYYFLYFNYFYLINKLKYTPYLFCMFDFKIHPKKRHKCKKR